MTDDDCERRNLPDQGVRRLLVDHARLVSHELRNRSGSAILAVQMLRRIVREGEPQVREAFDSLESVLRRMTGLTADVHALAQAHDPETPSDRPLDVVVHAVVADMTPVATEARVQLVLDGAPPSVLVDARLLRLALVNLIGSGIKYADAAKPDPWIRIRAFADDEDTWSMEVQDNGRGIAPQHLERIVDAGAAEHPGPAVSEGIGLVIAASALRKLGASISLESEPGHGTTFRFAVEVRAGRLAP